MPQPVKLSDALVLDARLAGEAQERSIAGQVEFWARLGRSVELLLDGKQVLALRRSADAQPLSQALASVETYEGRKRLQDVLANRPYPHFEQAPGAPRLLVRISADGTRTVGRFVNREFIEVGVKPRQPRPAARQAASPSSKKRLGEGAEGEEHPGRKTPQRAKEQRVRG